MSNLQSIQSLLQNDEVCNTCIEGSLVSGWSRSPNFFAIVYSSSFKNHCLLIITHPGIGSKEVNIRSKYALAIDESFRFSTFNKTNTEIQYHVSSGLTTYTVEFSTGEATNKFFTLLSEIHGVALISGTNLSFDWLKKYNKSSCSTDGSWPLSEISKISLSTPVVTDCNISSFDPFNKDDNSSNVDLLRDFVDINPFDQKLEKPPTILNTNEKVFDLKDFDPLSQQEIEQSIKSDQMNSDLLRRSREVVSTRLSSGKSWIERTMSQVSFVPIGNEEETNSNSTNDAFDVLDSVDVSKLESFPLSIPLNRTSTDIKGFRARENYLRLHMAAREKEFTDIYPFSVFTGTWNVNGQLAFECLKPWIDCNVEPPDVLAIGFQELDLSAEALVFNDSSREDLWIKAIENALPKRADYFKLKHVRLVGMMLVVYVQTKHKMQVLCLEAETNATGIMGMMGNKGGVAIRFQLHNSTICFVNCHLAAHQTEYERRNQDYREIYNKIKFTLFQPHLSISDHDVIIWMGDLNYRFEELDPDQIKALSDDMDYEKLYLNDQLNLQRRLGKVFEGFSEGQINFKPTYKYDPGTDNWDTSEKTRVPAWCDRILWKGKNIQQITYRSHGELKLSDHKPVSSLFNVGIKVVDRSNERKVFEEIVRKLDKKENESLPQVKLGKHDFQFGDIDFMVEKKDIIPIANIGQSLVEFEFIPKLDETDVTKPWIRVNPSAGFIMPGDVTEIELFVLVDKLSAPLISLEKFRIDDILVLHLVDGKDFFITISGTFKPSVFGSCLQSLCYIYGPISQLSLDKVIKYQNKSSSDTTDGIFDNKEPLEIPKELWLLIDHLHKYGMTQENILLQCGTDEEIIKIQKHLDTGTGGKLPGSIFSVGEALLLFLEALSEPVIPYQYQSICIDSCNNYVLCKQIICQIPECHANVFRYLTAFLRELLKQSAENKLDAKLLAAIFGGILLRPSIKQTKTQNKKTQNQIAQKKAKFVYHFLVNDYRD
ncbi:inositol polyphosphate 5-phosphatase OCRL isoform X3 [Hydra vulgaris]|uniref:Inositol polyphosphate 5-phosphatase OCRL isoform X3 n=1 Tax=Hydra vulgaris TaxID=6087 RepID=A0ABM4BLF2_HYDVU